jgi:sulfonate transport system substrate-binding protein
MENARAMSQQEPSPMRAGRQIMKNISAILAAAALVVGLGAGAQAQDPLDPPVALSVGYQKVGHLAPMILIEDELRSQGVEINLVEFVRYADARTALMSGSLDVASVGPADLAISLASGSTNVVGIMGVGSSPKYVIGRTGVTLDSWEDIKGKRLAIAPGSAVWFQFAATLIEAGVPYNEIEIVNIQGGGANFNQALKDGEIDAIVTWEPFESIPVMEGYGFEAKNLEYSQSEAVGAELGILIATKDAADNKREAVQRFVNAYLAAQDELAGDQDKFTTALQQLTGLDMEVSREIAKKIDLGSVVTVDQIERQARTFHEFDVIQQDVSGEIANYWYAEFVENARK